MINFLIMKNKKTDKARKVTMIIKGEKPEHYNAPFHPIILVTEKHTYDWESGTCKDGYTCVNVCGNDNNQFWFHLEKYKGYKIDESRSHFNLFDGTYTKDFLESSYLQECLSKAVWFSQQHPPSWLEGKVNFAEDSFSVNVILEDSGLCLLPESKSRDIENRREKYELPYWLQDK